MNIYDTAQNCLTDFINNRIQSYDKKRNYDLGQSSRDNTSNLSKYISHRILLEYDVIDQSLSKYKFYKIEKFIQEVFWRIYWKGWLEHRPDVWDDYIKYDTNKVVNHDYQNAISAKTDIDCFNHWVNELTETNYLHNHARMWFASIWIFTLNLPWQLGANFFMKHLFDGDAASNTLSWRWVAGLQTVGKHYQATSENIFKYTGKRFKPDNLNEISEPIEADKIYAPKPIKLENFKKKNDILIIFDNDLCLDIFHTYDTYQDIYLVLLDNNERKLKLSDKVFNFKMMLLNNIVTQYPKCKIINGNELNNILLRNKSVDIIYPGIGENLSFITYEDNSNSSVNIICREKDLHCWKYAQKGFFNFKKNIPSIIKKFNRTLDMF